MHTENPTLPGNDLPPESPLDAYVRGVGDGAQVARRNTVATALRVGSVLVTGFALYQCAGLFGDAIAELFE